MFIIKKKTEDKNKRLCNYFAEGENKEKILIASSKSSGSLWVDKIFWNSKGLEKIFNQDDIIIIKDVKVERKNNTDVSNKGHFFNVMEETQKVTRNIEKSLNEYSLYSNSGKLFKRVTKKVENSISYYKLDKINTNTLKVTKKSSSSKEEYITDKKSGMIISYVGDKLTYNKSLSIKIKEIQYVCGDTFGISNILKNFGYKYNKILNMYEK